ncbi:hypothetical protein [Sediminibacterium sp.]|uniref:hypothetical protein n=1 Tax=Sediminibacterium sp. TaxID=1917865 RepID=UPI0025E758A7|nr:hypothetical protein [Sediminibacterium sp.]
MTRGELTHHLIENECYPDDEVECEVSQLWINAINGESCYVPCEEELSVNTFCHVIYELGIQPPLEYDSFYAVYVGFRRELPIPKNI